MAKKSIEPEGDDDVEEEIVVLSPIAQPLAPSKLVKKILKLVKTCNSPHQSVCCPAISFPYSPLPACL